MKIEIDRDTCICVGNCIAEAPATFGADDEDKARLLDASGDPDPTIQVAAESCPVAAITLIGDDGKQLYP